MSASNEASIPRRVAFVGIRFVDGDESSVKVIDESLTD